MPAIDVCVCTRRVSMIFARRIKRCGRKKAGRGRVNFWRICVRNGFNWEVFSLGSERNILDWVVANC